MRDFKVGVGWVQHSAQRLVRLRASVVFVVLVGAASVLIGCNRSLETVLVEVATGEEITVEDLGRRSPETEARVVPLEDGERPFRYRIEPPGESTVQLQPRGDVRGAGPEGEHHQGSAAVTITVEGEIAGGELTVFSGDEGRRYPFSRILRDKRTGSADRYSLSFTLDNLRSAPWELEFSAPPGSAGYRVEAIRFGYTVPAFSYSRDGDTVHADSLFPVTLTDDTVKIPALAGMINDHTQAILIEYDAPESMFSDRRRRPVMPVIIHDAEGAEHVLDVRVRPGTRRIPVRPLRWVPEAHALTVETAAGDSTQQLEVRRLSRHSVPEDPREPILVDLEELQTWPRELWRGDDFELFSWSAYPNILWTDHRSYGTQSRMFKRLAFFVEKRGYQGRLLTNEQLRERHGWNAHNYRPVGLAEFFNAADATGFDLNPEELVLRDIAVRHGLLVDGSDAAGDTDDGDDRHDNGGRSVVSERWLPGTGGVLSISQDSFPALRRLLTVHEAMHGVFYEEPAFRRAAYTHWERTMAQRERDFWRFFLAWSTYDPDDQYLMVNEFQAYVLQQSEAATNWYLGTRIADRLRAAQPHRAESIDLLLRDYPDTFVRAAEEMNAALFESSGMVGGDPFCLRPRD